MDDFIERIQNIQLTEEEGEVVQVQLSHREKIIKECSLTLLGRFLTTKPYNQRAAKAILRAAWKLGNDLKIVDMGEGLFQFRFKMESQLLWVMHNGPWSFDNNLLVFRRWERGLTANSVTFTTLPIWVQVWGLPFDLIDEEAGWDIGRGLGNVVEVDNKTFSSDQARFIRIRIEIPLDKPIRRGGWVANPEGDQVRIGFKYERLVGLCYQCGKFGHNAKDCPDQRNGPTADRPYGEWLKAGYRRKEVGAEQSAHRPPATKKTPETTTATTVQTGGDAVNGINVQPGNDLRPTVVTEPQVTDDALNLGVNCTQSMGGDHPQMESAFTEMDFSDSNINEDITVEENLIIVPVNYEESVQIHSPVSQPQEQRSVPNKTSKPRKDDKAATWKKIPRKGVTHGCANPRDTTLCGSKRNQTETNLSSEEETRQNGKKSRGMGNSQQTHNSSTVEAAGQPRREQ